MSVKTIEIKFWTASGFIQKQLYDYMRDNPRGSGGGYLTKFNKKRLRPEVQPLAFLYTILAEKVPL